VAGVEKALARRTDFPLTFARKYERPPLSEPTDPAMIPHRTHDQASHPPATRLAYWAAVVPLLAIDFREMLRGIQREAERAETSNRAPATETPEAA
jgi:hypothetical protein